MDWLEHMYKWKRWKVCLQEEKSKAQSNCLGLKKCIQVRYCNNPAAINGGTPCAGESEMYEDCVPAWTDPAKNPDCVITGGWSVWSEASNCSTSCSSTRTRTCTNPMPINSKECEGEESESRLELQITLHLTYLNYISSDCTGGDCPSINFICFIFSFPPPKAAYHVTSALVPVQTPPTAR